MKLTTDIESLGDCATTDDLTAYVTLAEESLAQAGIEFVSRFRAGGHEFYVDHDAEDEAAAVLDKVFEEGKWAAS